jgi:hypothetical protein
MVKPSAQPPALTIAGFKPQNLSNPAAFLAISC